MKPEAKAIICELVFGDLLNSNQVAKRTGFSKRTVLNILNEVMFASRRVKDPVTITLKSKV